MAAQLVLYSVGMHYPLAAWQDTALEWSNIADQCQDIKILFLDLDGTLFDDDGHVPIAARRALEEIADSGLQTAIITGRGLRRKADVLDQLHPLTPEFLVFGHGASCLERNRKGTYDLLRIPTKRGMKVVEHKFLNPSLAQEFAARLQLALQQDGGNLTIGAESPEPLVRVSDSFPRDQTILDEPQEQRLPEKALLRHHDNFKLYLHSDTHNRTQIRNIAQGIRDVMVEQYGALAQFRIAYSHAEMAELCPPGVDKSIATDLVLKRSGWQKKNVAGAGDELPDLGIAAHARYFFWPKPNPAQWSPTDHEMAHQLALLRSQNTELSIVKVPSNVHGGVLHTLADLVSRQNAASIQEANARAHALRAKRAHTITSPMTVPSHLRRRNH